MSGFQIVQIPDFWFGLKWTIGIPDLSSNQMIPEIGFPVFRSLLYEQASQSLRKCPNVKWAKR
jgi:hypothetical protein